MTFRAPDDPFLKDAEGAARFCRDLIMRLRKKRGWKDDYGPAVYWAARWAAHWGQRSKAWGTR